jgi:dihydroorotate dehydrogenase electron transfer subunit
MSQFLGLVVENNEVLPGIRRMTVAAPRAAVDSARPGQFLHVRCSETYDPLLRRPLGLHSIRKTEGRLSLLFQVVGRGTGWLAGRQPGTTLDCLGPLGNGFELKSKTRRLLLMAGGLGQAPLLAAAESACARGVEVVWAAGGRSNDALLPVHYLPAEVEALQMTDDGSAGRQGLVTEVFGELFGWADQVFACGPEPMYRQMQSVAKTQGVRKGLVQISLEERMACGVGACYACVADTKHGLKKVCKDGPVFDLLEVAL